MYIKKESYWATSTWHLNSLQTPNHMRGGLFRHFLGKGPTATFKTVVPGEKRPPEPCQLESALALSFSPKMHRAK